jgi:Domain of unknown function (DUF397)
MDTYTWQKSSFSQQGANCLYLGAAYHGRVLLCESDDPATTLSLTPRTLGAFISTAKSGHLARGLR